MAKAASSILLFFFSLLHILTVCSPEITPSEELMEEQQTFHSSHRKLNNIQMHNSETKTTLHDDTYPPTIFPPTPITNPVTTPTPVTIPPANPTPTIVTVSPTNPATTPVTIPSTTPITVPSVNPVNPPVTVPTTTPVTNPVTTYPFTPPISTPVTNPVTTPTTNPVMPPATTNSPTGSGQSWCVAKTGAPETQLQTALDYACGIGGADCSTIQQTGSCYNPNTLQFHTSYAFNSYYQKNPVASSCDFGGTAMIVNINPSTGSCVYPSSSSSVAAATTTATTGAAGAASTGSPPSVLNTGDPTTATPTVFGSQPPPPGGTSISISACVKPMFTSIILAAYIVTARLVSHL